MLGLVDFVRAVRGSAGMALRRVHPLTGPALLVVLWVVALSTFFWTSGNGSDSVDDAAPRAAREDAAAHASGSDDGDDGAGARSAPGAAEAEDGVLDQATTTSGPGETSNPQERSPDGSDVPGATTPPPTNRPSWNESAPRPTTSTTVPSPSSTAPTTTTTAPPSDDDGGLVGGLLDLLGLGG